MIKWFGFTELMEIGIKLWFAPQISEHWPKNIPGNCEVKLIWLRRPGTASTFTPSDGTVQAWRTSAAETKFRIWVFIGMKTWLSESRRRNWFTLVWGVIKESNSIFLKSVYSYVQYHWWPVVLIVTIGLKTSSRRYRRRIEGIPKRARTSEGVTVQNSSRLWDSIIWELNIRLVRVDIMWYPTIQVVITTKVIL